MPLYSIDILHQTTTSVAFVIRIHRVSKDTDPIKNNSFMLKKLVQCHFRMSKIWANIIKKVPIVAEYSNFVSRSFHNNF